MEEREDQIDRLDFIRNQMNLLTLDVKKKIKEVTEEVANKVTSSLVMVSGSSSVLALNASVFHFKGICPLI